MRCTRGGGLDPIDAFGQFVYDRIINGINLSTPSANLAFIFKAKTEENGYDLLPMELYKLNLQSWTTGAAVAYRISKDKGGAFQYQALHNLSTESWLVSVNNADMWCICCADNKGDSKIEHIYTCH